MPDPPVDLPPRVDDIADPCLQQLPGGDWVKCCAAFADLEVGVRYKFEVDCVPQGDECEDCRQAFGGYEHSEEWEAQSETETMCVHVGSGYFEACCCPGPGDCGCQLQYILYEQIFGGGWSAKDVQYKDCPCPLVACAPIPPGPMAEAIRKKAEGQRKVRVKDG